VQALKPSDFESDSLAEPFAHFAVQNKEVIAAALNWVVEIRTSHYRGPISSRAGRMLWVIQTWYADSNESDIDVLLGERTVYR
jgi:hypothetical protein